MSELPHACDVGFKEWSGVCDALAAGVQSVILRKGGIAEEGGVFTPEHRVFWLYPTRLHESQQGLRVERQSNPAPEPGVVPVRSLVVVDAIRLLSDLDQLPALEPFHVWTPETVAARFHYRRPGLWALAVRVWTRAEATEVRETPEQQGCKTWVRLDPAISTDGLRPSLSDAEWRDRRAALLDVLGPELRDGGAE